MGVRWLILIVVAAGCGDDYPPPIEVSSGRLTAQIAPEPARITLLLDGAEVWSTRAGAGVDGKGPPHGFAAIGSRATEVEMMFGSYRFTETTTSEVWRAIDKLGSVTPTATGATFTLQDGDDTIGTGELTFVTTTRSGPDPDAAGFPRHVRIVLSATSGDRISLATSCDPAEHLLGLGGQSFDVDHRGETVPLWVQEDGIGKYPDPDDGYAGLWFFTGRKHSTHTPMPMLVSSRGYALAVDTDARATFALGSERPDAARFETWQRDLDLQVFIGDGPRDGAWPAWRPAMRSAT
jgi:alpha-glucosidase (family GH31 glycosyl hydrolase)